MKQRVGHYDIVAELGRGGMGVVYKGFESTLGRYVAIKVLADSLAHDPGVRERFLREARSMAALNDPHIIQIHSIGEDEGHPYFVMEFVEGESLGSLLKREGRLTLEQSLKVIHQTASGLATAHDRGVVHRDIKPGNLMISSRGSVKIADFGIALSNQDLSKKLTSTGEFVGTPGYLSPEVCLGKPVDQRSDIFSLGIVLFEMLTGKMPFTDESPLGLMLEVVRAEIPDVRQLNANVDDTTSRILSRMIAKDPAHRYQNCHELAADLLAHPLVARGGPITLQPKLSPAAATLVGQKTPLPAALTTPITAPTPMRAPGGAPTHITAGDAAPPPLPGAAAPARPSVLDRPTVHASAPRRSSALPWAIAAVLLLAAGAGAWTLRDRIPGLGAGSMTTTQPATSPDPAAGLQASAPNGSATTSTSGAAATADPTRTASTEPAPAPTPSVAEPATLAANTAGANAPSTPPSEPPPIAPASVPAADSEPPAPRASQADVDALRNLPAAQAESSAPPQIAKAPPPSKPAASARPSVPTVAVVYGGDEVIAEPARDAITDLLQSRGFRVIEAGRVSGSAPNLKSLAGRADAVVFVQARPVGSEQIHYYGQSSTLYTVQVGVKAYRTRDGSVLWSSPAEQVNFTTLNAAEKAREAVDPMLDAVDRNLAEFRSGGRG